MAAARAALSFARLLLLAGVLPQSSDAASAGLLPSASIDAAQNSLLHTQNSSHVRAVANAHVVESAGMSMNVLDVRDDPRNNADLNVEDFSNYTLNSSRPNVFALKGNKRVWHGRANTAEPVTIEFVGRDGRLFANGQQFFFKGLNWYGSEDQEGVVQGLDLAEMDFYFEFMQKHQFNAIRVLFNHDFVLKNNAIPAARFNSLRNPELVDPSTGFGVKYVESFLQLAKAAARRNILVLLACHRLAPDAWPGDGLWYQSAGPITEDRVKASWSTLAGASRTAVASKLFSDEVLFTIYSMLPTCALQELSAGNGILWQELPMLVCHCHLSTVDLQNEPHKATWGKGSQRTDWNSAAERLGNHVLQACPRWLIFVEGIFHGAVGDAGDNEAYWWGENLVGAQRAPVKLSDPSKLVYSPHTYGPSAYEQPYFKARNFPDNMPDIWMAHFLASRRSSGVPFVIGEMGGKYEEASDRKWQNKAIAYFSQQGVGLFYFCLNPTSTDTKGVLLDGWKTANPDKIQLLSQLPSTDISSLLGSPPPSPRPSPPPHPRPAAAPSAPTPPPPPPRTPCAWTHGNPCAFACDLTELESGADCGRYESAMPCEQAYFKGSSPGATTTLRRCTFLGGKCAVANEAERCASPTNSMASSELPSTPDTDEPFQVVHRVGGDAALSVDFAGFGALPPTAPAVSARMKAAAAQLTEQHAQGPSSSFLDSDYVEPVVAGSIGVLLVALFAAVLLVRSRRQSPALEVEAGEKERVLPKRRGRNGGRASREDKSPSPDDEEAPRVGPRASLPPARAAISLSKRQLPKSADSRRSRTAKKDSHHRSDARPAKKQPPAAVKPKSSHSRRKLQVDEDGDWM